MSTNGSFAAIEVPWTELIGWVPVLLAAIIAATAAITTARISASSALRGRITEVRFREQALADAFHSRASASAALLVVLSDEYHRILQRTGDISASALQGNMMVPVPELPPRVYERFEQADSEWQAVQAASVSFGNAEITAAITAMEAGRQAFVLAHGQGGVGLQSLEAGSKALAQMRDAAERLDGSLRQQAVAASDRAVSALRTSSLRKYVASWSGDVRRRLDSETRQP